MEGQNTQCITILLIHAFPLYFPTTFANLSIIGPICEILLGIVVLIEHWLGKVHILPLRNIEILELALPLAHPDLMALVVVEPLVDPAYSHKYRDRPACSWRRSSMML